MNCFNDRRKFLPRAQREMPFLLGLEPVKWVPSDTVFARNFGVHAPHMSRFVNPDSKAPMELHPDLIPDFESYTGWRGITQYLARISKVTLMEQVIEARRTA